MSRIGRRRRIHAARKAAQVPEVVDYEAMDYQELRRRVKAAAVEPDSFQKADLIAVLKRFYA